MRCPECGKVYNCSGPGLNHYFALLCHTSSSTRLNSGYVVNQYICCGIVIAYIVKTSNPDGLLHVVLEKDETEMSDEPKKEEVKPFEPKIGQHVTVEANGRGGKIIGVNPKSMTELNAEGWNVLVKWDDGKTADTWHGNEELLFDPNFKG